MNWNELPPDDWRSETESPAEREQLGEMERRLKAARPKPVRFDAVAWERIVSASKTAVTPEQVTVAMPGLTIPLRRRWSNRMVGTIAAVWLSGVLVGSGVMFLMMNRDGMTHAKNHEPPVAVAQQDFEDPSASSGIQSPSEHLARDRVIDKTTGNASSTESSVASSGGGERLPVVNDDSVRELRSVSWLGTSAFEREIPLRAIDRAWFRGPAAGMHSARSRSSGSGSQERLKQSESQRELARSFVPPPAATPRRILEELRMEGEIL